MNRKFRLRLLSALAAVTLLAGTAQSMAPTVGFAAANLISNSTFETGTKDWGIYKESGGAATLTTEDGKLALKISSVGTLNYAVQMFYDIIPLYQNGVYHLHYEISSSVPRYVEGMIQQNGGTYQAYTWKGMNVGTEPTVVDYDFTMEEETDIMTKFCFNCGKQKTDGDLGAHTIYLDNVTLELVDDSKVDYGSVGPYQSPILTNQIGYRTNDKKTAVVRKDGGNEFKVVNADTKEVVYTGTLGAAVSNGSADETDRVADFSSVTKAGKYYITCGSLDKSYTFEIADNPYAKLTDEAVRMFYLQRCGCEVKDADFGHAACHAEMATVYGTNDKIDVSGGWHDAGDYGRYTVAGAKAVADLLYAYQANPSLFSDKIGIPESNNGVPDILDETRYELEWMLKMQAANGGVYHKVTCATFPGYVAPTAETKPLIVTPISTTATADFCASMAMAAEFYKSVDATFAEKCLNAAKKAWDFLQQNPNFIFKNPADISTGEYGDKTDRDERYWAACQMYRATGDAQYLNGVSSVSTGLDWSTVGDYGNIALATMKNSDHELVAKAKAALADAAASFEKTVSASPYGSPITKYNWGSNMTIANAGVVLGLEGKQDAANLVLDHLLGLNPNGTCYVTGFGTVAPEAPHHRPSMAAGKAQPGMLVGGVNSQLEDSAAKAYCKTSPAAKCYIDNAESYSTNEITIYWNSPLVYLLAVTEAAQNAQPEETTTTTTTTTTTETTTTTTTTETSGIGTTTKPETTTTTAAETQPEGKLFLGDVNESGKVDVSDAVLLARFVAEDKSAKITAQGQKNADTNKNGQPDSDDVTQILKYVVKLIHEF